MFWYGPDRIDGIFFDTGSTRGPINYSQEEEDRDISSHTMLATYTKNLYRDHVLGQRDENFTVTNILTPISNLATFKVKFGRRVILSQRKKSSLSKTVTLSLFQTLDIMLTLDI